MAGEYQLAEKVLADTIESYEGDADTLARAFLYQLIEHYKTSRSIPDIISELEQHIRALEDGGEHVITRGC